MQMWLKGVEKSKLNPYSTKVGRFLGWHRTFYYFRFSMKKAYHISTVRDPLADYSSLSLFCNHVFFILSIYFTCVCWIHVHGWMLTPICLWTEGRDQCILNPLHLSIWGRISHWTYRSVNLTQAGCLNSNSSGPLCLYPIPVL